MKDDKKRPDYLIEVSWEVCNLVGGIYTVLSTKAKTLQQLYKKHLIFIGPDLWENAVNESFIELDEVLHDWKIKASLEGLKVRTGYWDIPGKPIVILIDFESYYSQKNQLYGQMWEWFKVDSLHAYGDYDEASMFAYSSALVTQSLYHYFDAQDKNFVAQFNEWTTGMGLLYLKKNEPNIATVFTTHATSVGRSIAGNNKPLYDYLPGYFGDQMARELNMESKHSVEKQAAHQADCFTTVSDITAEECRQLLERVPLVTPNGFEENFVPKKKEYNLARNESRNKLLNLVEKLTGSRPSDDAFLVATAGRYEFKNKGIDVFIDALNELRQMSSLKETVAFILVPGWVEEPRKDLQEQLNTPTYENHALPEPIITHTLHNYAYDQVINMLHMYHFKNDSSDKLKVIFIPSYLQGNDGILNITYYQTLIGLDVTIFPSYYEPWGYTPLESIAFGIPTITTTLSGFGRWCINEGVGHNILSGVKVINRNDSNRNQVVSEIAKTVIEIEQMSPNERVTARKNAQDLSEKAQWKHFIHYYQEAYDKAIRVAQQRKIKQQ